jgi:hypothetical protein
MVHVVLSFATDRPGVGWCATWLSVAPAPLLAKPADTKQRRDTAETTNPASTAHKDVVRTGVVILKLREWLSDLNSGTLFSQPACLPSQHLLLQPAEPDFRSVVPPLGANIPEPLWVHCNTHS